jgi:hypothetical protein
MSFFLRGVIEVSAEATDTVRKILTLREEHRALITAKLGRRAAHGLRLLESLYERPVVSVGDVERLNETTFAPSNNLVGSMCELGVLREMTGNSRNRRFLYADYVDLFSRNGELPGGGL